MFSLGNLTKSQVPAVTSQNDPDANQTVAYPTNASSGTKRVNVVFSTDQYDKLQNLATSQNITMSDALRQAISLSTLIVGANEDANTQILLKQGDNVQELKLVR